MTIQWHKQTIEITTRGKGMYPITQQVQRQVQQWQIEEGMCFLFIQHASASLLINESYDPSARADMETFMERISPEGEHWQSHTLEGADDSPAHIRTMLTHTDLTIPIDNGSLSLGTWQGIYVFEHRARGHRRQVLIRCWQFR